MNEQLQILYSKLPPKSKVYLEAIIRKLSHGYDGQLRLHCVRGTISKMQEVKDA